MTAITEDTLRGLAGFDGGGVPVTTVYLDVDGRRLLGQRDVDQELDRVLRSARARSDADAIAGDLARIESYVHGGFDRSRVRGLAMFSCAAKGLWEVVPLPVRVRSRVVVNDQPAVGQLEAIAEEQRRFGVLLVDRKLARMFVFELDELVEQTETVGESARDYDVRGEKERGDTSGHVEAMASTHIKTAAALAFASFKAGGFEHLCVGAPEDLVSEVESALHPYLRERLVGRLNVTPQSSLDAVGKAVAEVEETTERAKEAALVERMIGTVGAGGRAVAGLAPTLSALGDRRVETLLVSHGYSEEGWRCENTGALFATRPHREEPANLRRVDDVVEEAIEDALSQGVHVEMVVGNADMDVHGRVGALLRY